ncbi:MAG: HD-GYP domain-containing protein [Phycisphaeraceae bacterium]
MLRIHVNKASPGMRLALPVQNPKAPSQALLKMGYELNDSILQRLSEYGVRVVWVRYPSLDFLARFLDREAAQRQQNLVHQVSKSFEDLQLRATARLPYENYLQSLQDLIDHLAKNPAAGIFLGDLADTSNDLLRHSASVAYLTLLMGMKLESYLVRERRHVPPGRAKEVVNLGLGAMLHDAGILQLPDEVRERQAEAPDESDEAWQQHPALGFELLRGRIEPTAATVVLNHHQHDDGSGYAGGDFPTLSGKSIHVFARITAVADQFDNLTHPPGLPTQPTVWALGAMLSDPLRKRFDPEVLKALVAVVPPYPPGSVVELSDGRHAVCVDHNAHAPCRPKVQILLDPAQLEGEDVDMGEEIDLAEHNRGLYVVEHDGHDVRDMNFALPEYLQELTGQFAHV